jgi:hypothetical protein
MNTAYLGAHLCNCDFILDEATTALVFSSGRDEDASAATIQNGGGSDTDMDVDMDQQ